MQNGPPSTPYVRINAKQVQTNIQRASDYAQKHNLGVRPHIKTHKSLKLSKKQLDAGAIGLTVAKLSEAKVIAAATDQLLMAYPIVDPVHGQQLAQLIPQIPLIIAVDSLTAIQVISQAIGTTEHTAGILIEMDVGLGRMGVQTPQQALSLAQKVGQSPGLRLDGIMCYPGHVSAKPEHQDQPLAKIQNILQTAIDLWAKHGLEAKIVSGGSTPTLYQSHLMPALTEIRPGTYVFNDMNTVVGGFAPIPDCAAHIITTVVSNAVPGQIVIDAGSKTLTSDLCIHDHTNGFGHILQFPQAKITKLSEEHGQVDVQACDSPPKVGQQLHVIPNHICPCMNLQDTVWWDHGNGPLEPVTLQARGKSN